MSQPLRALADSRWLVVRVDNLLLVALADNLLLGVLADSRQLVAPAVQQGLAALHHAWAISG